MRIARFAALALVALVAGCGPSPSVSTSPAAPSASVRAQAGFPPGCAPVDLRSPTGERVDLTGEWGGTGKVVLGYTERIWLNQLGNCVYGSVLGDLVLADSNAVEIITNLTGQISSGFEIGFDVDIVFHEGSEEVEHSTMVVLIEWDDDGQLRLREDRAVGEIPARCARDAFACPDPVVWYRVDTPQS